jgi:hypothetical protein
MKKLIAKIKALAAKVWQAVEKAWDKLPDASKEYVAIAVKVTQAVKETIQEGTFTGSIIDAIVAKIPGKLDDVMLAKARDFIPVLLVKLSLSQSILDIEDDQERLVAVIERVKLFDDDQREAFWDSFAKKVLQYASDGELSWSDCNAIVKWYFDNKVKR